MVSVCIPVYNFDCNRLIHQLTHQLSCEMFEYEVLVYDDGSESNIKKLNREVAIIKNVRYLELEENIGRSLIRNRLAKDALYPKLLFIDCDMSLTINFIRNYLDNIDNSVVCGGIIYEDKPIKNYLLRWKYGVKREVKPLIVREKHVYKSFMSSNFLIDREIFYKYCFDQSITTYGHEDTLFGLTLEKAKIGIKHIDNPAFHLGLENNEQFMGKVKESVRTLFLLFKEGKLGREVRLIDSYFKVKKIFGVFCLYVFYLIFEKLLEKLIVRTCSIFLLNMLKLLYFSYLERDMLNNLAVASNKKNYDKKPRK